MCFVSKDHSHLLQHSTQKRWGMGRFGMYMDSCTVIHFIVDMYKAKPRDFSGCICVYLSLITSSWYCSVSPRKKTTDIGRLFLGHPDRERLDKALMVFFLWLISIRICWIIYLVCPPYTADRADTVNQETLAAYYFQLYLAPPKNTTLKHAKIY